MTTELTKAAQQALEACPFCGGEPHDAHHIEYGRWAVTCKCGVMGACANTGPNASEAAKIKAYNDARAAWNTRALTQRPAAQTEREAWQLINPQGQVVAVERTAIKALARIDGYKPTVEGLLGYEEAGWRVVPASLPAPQQATPAPSAVFSAWWSTQGQSMWQHVSESPAEFARRLAAHAWTEATRAAQQATPAHGAEQAGLVSTNGHLSMLLNESAQMLAQLRAMVDALHDKWSNGGRPERGEFPLLDRVDDWLNARPSEMLEPQQATPEPVALGPLAQRNIFDAIRSAYDLGYNDARNAFAVPGDSAPGYKGRDVEADHGGALFNTLARRLRNAATPEPVHADDLAVDRFAAAMKAKLAASRAKGRGGWDDPEQCTVEHLARLLVDHIPKGDPVDVANFAMMLHQRGADSSVLATATPEPVGEHAATVAEVHMSRYTLEWNGAPLPEGTKLYTRHAAAPAGMALVPMGADRMIQLLHEHYDNPTNDQANAFYVALRAAEAHHTAMLAAAQAKGADHG